MYSGATNPAKGRMRNEMRNKRRLGTSSERGAALMTVLVASLLLGTACIALLSAVSDSSKNNTDALSESKAYWAAESGLQASINFLRNTPGMDYNKALQNPTLAYDAANYPTGLNYVDGRVTMNTEAQYAVNVVNPDADLPYTFYSTGSFNSTEATGVTLENSATPNPRICFPNCAATDRTIVTLAGIPSTENSGFPLLATFTVERTGLGAVIPNGVTFRIEFIMTSPRNAGRTIRGKIAPATADGPVNITFDSQVAELAGSVIELCNTQSPGTPPAGEGTCPNFSFSMPSTTLSQNFPVYVTATNTEPYRLVVTATGFGPQASQKRLEGIIVKDLLAGLPSTSALTMVGPGANIDFGPGSGTPTYCGVDPGIEEGEEVPNNNELDCELDPNAPTAPAIGVSDQTALDEVNDALGNTEVIPAPDILTDGPEWLQSATAFHEYINELRNRAQNSGLYIPDGSGTTNLNDYVIGNYANGSGLTFCEGECSVGPRTGGGILVVNGNFDYNGNYDHTGTIIVVGAMHRDGAGNGIILGSVIVADYNPDDLAGGFLSPSFTSSGGGTADIIYNGASSAYDGTTSVTNLMIGVAEK